MTAIIDIETAGKDVKTAEFKIMGGLDVDTGEVTILTNKQNIQVKDYIKKHKVIIGFNFKSFDKPILERYLKSTPSNPIFKYHPILDLWEALAEKGDGDFGRWNKERLKDIKPEIQFKDFKLKTIIEALKLDDEGNKGEINYDWLKSDELIKEHWTEISKYLTQDLKITKKLFDWYFNLFKPILYLLPKKDVENLKHLSCTTAGMGYKIMCHMAGLPEDKLKYGESA
jgi:hypothetical protein